MPRPVSWSSDSAGVMYRARRPSDGAAGYHRETISSRALTPAAQGSGRETSVSHTDVVPTGHGPVGTGRDGVGPGPAGPSPASAEVPTPPIITRSRPVSPGLLTRARAERHGLRASSPAADQLVFGDPVLGEKALRVAVLG